MCGWSALSKNFVELAQDCSCAGTFTLVHKKVVTGTKTMDLLVKMETERNGKGKRKEMQGGDEVNQSEWQDRVAERSASAGRMGQGSVENLN
jgi:hypothetical protein